MIPISSSNYQQGCNPISSNCVVWQGPDLAIIGLCNGDTVSDVIAKLAAKLVEIQDSVSLAGVDLSCLQLSTAPTSIEELFQVIVDEICTLNAGSGTTGGTTTTATVIATLPVCLQYTNLENDLVTQLPVDEYAELVAAKVCEIIADVTTLQTQVADHETRITTLEGNSVTQYTTPQITPSCVLPAVPTDIDVVLDELEDQFCTLNDTLGGSTSLLAASTYQCDLLGSDNQLSGSGTMSSLTGWNTQVNNVAQSLQNMWLTLCDMRAAIKDIQTNCCNITCNDVIFSAFGSYSSGTITLNFGGSSVPTGFTECNALGASVTISDAANNVHNTRVPVLTALAGDDTDTIDIFGTQLSTLSNYYVTITLCVSNGDITCEKTLSFEVTNDAASCAIPTGVTATIS